MSRFSAADAYPTRVIPVAIALENRTTAASGLESIKTDKQIYIFFFCHSMMSSSDNEKEGADLIHNTVANGRSDQKHYRLAIILCTSSWSETQPDQVTSECVDNLEWFALVDKISRLHRISRSSKLQRTQRVNSIATAL
jgi:hypothetical protein